MRTIVLAATALVASASLAFAADLPQRQVAPAPHAAPSFTWTGFYVGAQAGYAWGDSTGGAYRKSTSVVDAEGAIDPDGVFGGLHAGYNYQISNLVLGVELDGNYAGVNGKSDRFYDSNGRLIPAGNYAKSEMDWNGSLRLRAGYAFDRFLPYITGGVALAHYKFTPTYWGAGRIPGDKTHVGWTIGAGADYAITNNLVAGVEYRYSDYGKEKYDIPGFPLFETRVDLKTHDVRVRLGYKF